jgi:isopenicillin-N N-acyltransferase like protein
MKALLLSRNRFVLIVLLLITAFIRSASAAQMAPRMLIAEKNGGYLERVGSQLVLHLKGSPEQMGRQQGALLGHQIRDLLNGLPKFSDADADEVWEQQTDYIPQRFLDEMRALADSSGIDYDSIRRMNTIPELFHCSGFSVFGKATKNGQLYHGRILDYGTDLGLQKNAVVVIAEPAGYIPFVSVTYAGFLGSVTGMNMQQVSFGELGGKSAGRYMGTPMAFLLRRGLEEAATLEEAKDLFSNSPRTCKYYYVISDAKSNEAVGVSATSNRIEFIGPNEACGPLNAPMQDVVALSGRGRYTKLTNRIKDKWGALDPESCLGLMRRPVSMKTCLHCALMAPQTGEIWVANASRDGKPASEQPYTYLNVPELMARRP